MPNLRFCLLLLSMLIVALPSASWAESLSAVISANKGGPLSPACREKLSAAVEKGGFEILPQGADPVTADVVFSVEITVQRRGERRSAACAINAFEAATSARVAAVAELGQPMATEALAISSVCQGAADQLAAPLGEWKQLIGQRGMGHTLTLRWTGELRPRPQLQLASYLKKSGLVFHQRLATAQQIQYLIFAKAPAAELEQGIRQFLLQSYAIHSEPPVSLPSNKRSFMYLLRKK